MLLARPVLIAVCVCLTAGACRPGTDRVTLAAERAGPHLASFERFERWARRAAASEGAAQGRHAFAELVFAPIRHTPELIGAWVRVEGDRPRVLALPADAQPPNAERSVTLRDPRLGALRIATVDRCAVAGARGAIATTSCVVIARAERAEQPRPVSVTMAFSSEPR